MAWYAMEQVKKCLIPYIFYYQNNLISFHTKVVEKVTSRHRKYSKGFLNLKLQSGRNCSNESDLHKNLEKYLFPLF
jgi:hypothetical protein